MIDELIFGKRYKLWREGEYIGTATWTEDHNIGNSFIELIVDADLGVVSKVYTADKWELLDKPVNNN
jgi:hypothetical protein